MPTCEDVCALLRCQQALLVHFSTVMKREGRPEYPGDLKWVIHNARSPNCTPRCSTVLPNDGTAHAPGSVGLILQPLSDVSVRLAHHCDAGTFGEGLDLSGFGSNPTIEDCKSSITKRGAQYNEWVLTDFAVRGLLLLPPLRVKRRLSFIDPITGGTTSTSSEAPVEMASIRTDFPELRMFTIQRGRHFEIRDDGQLAPISRDEIMGSLAPAALTQS